MYLLEHTFKCTEAGKNLFWASPSLLLGLELLDTNIGEPVAERGHSSLSVSIKWTFEVQLLVLSDPLGMKQETLFFYFAIYSYYMNLIFPDIFRRLYRLLQRELLKTWYAAIQIICQEMLYTYKHVCIFFVTVNPLPSNFWLFLLAVKKNLWSNLLFPFDLCCSLDSMKKNNLYV